ncbi:MAG TPA: molecular chaperone TorD family protein [Symbiobacteriaceae bacterium]|jgi:TorA maturation chaperone TorD|nr:molecular chaperone TorD family protein [Symbiobacteriaceae bacterium]
MGTQTDAFIASEELEAVLEARAFAYRMLANAFLAEPVREQIAALAATGAVSLFPYAADSELVAQGVAEATAYLSAPANGTDAAFDALVWDYTRMFIGPGKLPAPPWESAYSNEDRLLFQEQTLAVRKAFRQYGLVLATAPSNPEDHIGLELEFLYHTGCVALEQAKARDVAGLERVLRDQQAFLNEHLLTWAPDFANDVAKSSTTGFYRGMARILSGFLRVDRAVLEELLCSLQ